MKIAIVDDEKNVRLAIRTALKKEGFEVVEYSNGKEALESFNDLPDLFILDIMMPVMDGICFLRKLRENQIETPVMFLTSKDDEFDKVLGLELGADDYLCKPFSIRELIARIHVLMRRSHFQEYVNQNKKEISAGPVTINELSYTATLMGSPLNLTITEFRILQAFLEHKNEVLSREQLIQISYPEETYLNDRAIDCHINRLRKKLNSPECENCIETVYGAGYKFTIC